MAAVLASSPPSSSDCAHDGTPDTPGAPTAATHRYTPNQREYSFEAQTQCFFFIRQRDPHVFSHTLVLFLSAFSSDISSSFSSSCSRHMFSSFVRVANSYTTKQTHNTEVNTASRLYNGCTWDEMSADVANKFIWWAEARAPCWQKSIRYENRDCDREENTSSPA